MKPKIACPSPRVNTILRTESISFSQIPGQSILFTTYQSDPLSLKKFYPSAVASHTEIAGRVSEVLGRYEINRDELCDALAEMNRGWNAGAKTEKNIDLFRKSDSVAVVTGQQTGLFSGPIYTIYKALSAVRMAEWLCNQGVNAVPIFWAATEDHDFEEVSHTGFLNKDGEVFQINDAPANYLEGSVLGDVTLDETIAETIKEMFRALPQTEFSEEIRSLLDNCWKNEASYGDAFCKYLSALFARYGLIVIDPLNPRVKSLCAPIYKTAVEKADVIVEAIRSRSRELESEGYHTQVNVPEDHFPFFWHGKDGVRRAIKKNASGKYKPKGIDGEFTLSELAQIAEQEPHRLSPGVMLRPVVQDYLFPSVCYFGGAAEIAYFAQNSEAYRVLGRPTTTIFHRQSFTVVEAKHSRTLEKYNLIFRDLLQGIETVLPGVVEKYIAPEIAKDFADVEEKINAQLNRLDQLLAGIDPTVAGNLATRRRKILYHIGALRQKTYRAELERNEIVTRQINSAFNSILPDGQLQERTLNVNTFLNRYGPNFIDWIYHGLDLGDNGHRIIFL